MTIPYGISSGAFVALIGSPVVVMGSPTSVGERTGLLFSFTALGALAGPPISGAIRKNTGSWENVGYYAGMGPTFASDLIYLLPNFFKARRLCFPSSSCGLPVSSSQNTHIVELSSIP